MSLLSLFMAASRNQFHQYYICGKFQDCSMYGKAMKSCISYKATKSIEDRVNFFSCRFFETKTCELHVKLQICLFIVVFLIFIYLQWNILCFEMHCRTSCWKHLKPKRSNSRLPQCGKKGRIQVNIGMVKNRQASMNLL